MNEADDNENQISLRGIWIPDLRQTLRLSSQMQPTTALSWQQKGKRARFNRNPFRHRGCSLVVT